MGHISWRVYKLDSHFFVECFVLTLLGLEMGSLDWKLLEFQIIDLLFSLFTVSKGYPLLREESLRSGKFRVLDNFAIFSHKGSFEKQIVEFAAIGGFMVGALVLVVFKGIDSAHQVFEIKTNCTWGSVLVFLSQGLIKGCKGHEDEFFKLSLGEYVDILRIDVIPSLDLEVRRWVFENNLGLVEEGYIISINSFGFMNHEEWDCKAFDKVFWGGVHMKETPNSMHNGLRMIRKSKSCNIFAAAACHSDCGSSVDLYARKEVNTDCYEEKNSVLKSRAFGRTQLMLVAHFVVVLSVSDTITSDADLTFGVLDPWKCYRVIYRLEVVKELSQDCSCIGDFSIHILVAAVVFSIRNLTSAVSTATGSSILQEDQKGVDEFTDGRPVNFLLIHKGNSVLTLDVVDQGLERESKIHTHYGAGILDNWSTLVSNLWPCRLQIRKSVLKCCVNTESCVMQLVILRFSVLFGDNDVHGQINMVLSIPLGTVLQSESLCFCSAPNRELQVQIDCLVSTIVAGSIRLCFYLRSLQRLGDYWGNVCAVSTEVFDIHHFVLNCWEQWRICFRKANSVLSSSGNYGAEFLLVAMCLVILNVIQVLNSMSLVLAMWLEKEHYCSL